MTIQYWTVPFVLLLLWMPRQLLRHGLRVGRKNRGQKGPEEERDRADISVRLREEFAKTRNWIDFGRALAGGLLWLKFTLTLSEDATDHERTTVFVLHLAVLLIAVAVQTVRKEVRVMLFPPLFFVMGLGFGMVGTLPTVVGMALTFAINLGLPSPAMFLTVFGAIAAGIGWLFFPAAWPYALAMFGTALVPVMMGLLLRRRLVTIVRRPRFRG